MSARKELVSKKQTLTKTISPSKNVIEASIQIDLVLVEILEQLLSAEHFGDADQLIVVVVAMKERLLSKDHRSEHAPETPHVQ